MPQEREKLKEWGMMPMGSGLVCVAGPCAAESEEQVMACGRSLKALGVSAFRCGVWKPRTRPGCFEGRGVEALPWLARVQRELQLPVATEVATPEHVEAALGAGIPILWLGARSTANPFLVQEVANALRGCQVTLFVKNPISPDLNLWLGAVERLLNAGLTKVGAILRGYSVMNAGEYRNEPGWHLAIDFRQRMPRIPMLCDPSHIAGRREPIPHLAQEALNLAFDGVMVECHPNPCQALSDAAQQLTPGELEELLGALRVRQHGGESDVRLAGLRSQIDELDYDILAAVARRMEIVREIGAIKRSRNLAVLQAERWGRVLEEMVASGSRLGLSPELSEQIARLLHASAIAEQQKMM